MEEEAFRDYLEKLNSLCKSSGPDDVSPTSSLEREISRETLIFLYNIKNMAVMDIASLFNCNRRTVHRHLRKYGLTKGRSKSLIENIHKHIEKI